MWPTRFVLALFYPSPNGATNGLYSLAGLSRSYGPAFGPLSLSLGFELIFDERRIPGSKFAVKVANRMMCIEILGTILAACGKDLIKGNDLKEYPIVRDTLYGEYLIHTDGEPYRHPPHRLIWR
jgi:hypothetical protein